MRARALGDLQVYLDPQTTHKNLVYHPIILGVKPTFQLEFRGSRWFCFRTPQVSKPQKPKKLQASSPENFESRSPPKRPGVFGGAVSRPPLSASARPAQAAAGSAAEPEDGGGLEAPGPEKTRGRRKNGLRGEAREKGPGRNNTYLLKTQNFSFNFLGVTWAVSVCKR